MGIQSRMEPTTSWLEAWEKSSCWIEMLLVFRQLLVLRQGKTSLLGPVKNNKTCILFINIYMNTSLKLESLK